MSPDDFDGIKLSKARLTYIGALLGLAMIGWNIVGDYNRRGYEIERLTERDAARSSDLAKLNAKFDAQSREITREFTELKIAINRLSDQLERSNGE